MAQRGKFSLIKVNCHHLWKNNFINLNQQLYSRFFFQINLLEKYIHFFFLYPISKYFGKCHISENQKLYLSQIWIHSYNNYIIISFSIKYRDKKIYYKNLIDNYLRLKYSTQLINQKYFF